MQMLMLVRCGLAVLVLAPAVAAEGSETPSPGRADAARETILEARRRVLPGPRGAGRAGDPARGWVEEGKVTAGDGAAEDFFGQSVSLSGDAALVGAYQDDDAGSRSGSAYVFVRTGAVWSQQAKLTASDAEAEDWFGYAVSISGDTALVGAPWEDEVNWGAGAAYVFVRTGAVWSQQAKLMASDATGDEAVGYSVSLFGDTALVGAPLDKHSGAQPGSAHVFVRTGTVWNEVAKLVARDPGAYDRFGISVSLSGGSALVGAWFDDVAGAKSGSAYVFASSGSVWSQQAKLSASDAAAGHYFGWAVSLSGDSALVGAYGDGHAGNKTGAAYVFTRTGSAWSQQAKLTAMDAASYDSFGNSVSLSGETALVGARYDDDLSFGTGSAYFFVRSGAAWSQQAKLTASDAAADDHFGSSVSLAGGNALIGAMHDDDSGVDSGSAYVFVQDPPPPVTYCTAKVNSQGCTPVVGFSGFPSVSDPNPFDITASMVINDKSGLFFYGLSGRDKLPFQGGILCAAPPLGRTPVQNSGGNPPPADCSGTFSLDFNAWMQGGGDPSLAPGVQVDGQYWYRDPQSPSTTGLTDAIELVIAS